jgi:adenosylhomocysteinase
VEINLKNLAKMAKSVNKGVREYIDAYNMADGRVIYVLGEGRLINLAAAEVNPASVMDMSFATQALSSEYVVKNKGKLKSEVYLLPKDLEQEIAFTKLTSMGFKLDKLTAEQEKYLNSWEVGT